MSYILEAKNITKRYGDKLALNNVSFNLTKGKIFGLLGANGSGKTTLSEIIAGINKPTNGHIVYKYDYKNTFKEGIGMQFQDSIYPSGLSVKDIIYFARNLRKINITNNQLKETLETFQMSDFFHQKVKSLSGGQKQKINIFLSVIHKPKIIILDELTTGLDISSRTEIIKFTKNIIKKQKITAILVSHHMHEIEELADQILVLSNGKLIKEDSCKNMIANYGSLDKYMINLISNENKNYKKENELQLDDLKEKLIELNKNIEIETQNIKNDLTKNKLKLKDPKINKKQKKDLKNQKKDLITKKQIINENFSFEKNSLNKKIKLIKKDKRIDK